MKSLAMMILGAASINAALMMAADVGEGVSGGKEFESETGFFSLAALAGADTDSITAITSRTPPAGVFRIRGVSVKGSESEPKDGKPPLIRFAFVYEVMGGKATSPDVDVEKMVGRKLTESFTIWPNDIEEGIGMLKGRYQKVGLVNSGMPMGGVEGLEPGWMDGFVGHELDLKIRTYLKDGETRAGFDWLPAEAPAEEEVA